MENSEEIFGAAFRWNNSADNLADKFGGKFGAADAFVMDSGVHIRGSGVRRSGKTGGGRAGGGPITTGDAGTLSTLSSVAFSGIVVGITTGGMGGAGM